MKGGAFLALAAMRHLVRAGRTTPLPIRHLLVSEEEVGSPTSRAVIEREARRAVAVLVTEPAREGGRIVTARKGTARFDLTVRGQLAHSGARHQDGRVGDQGAGAADPRYRGDDGLRDRAHLQCRRDLRRDAGATWCRTRRMRRSTCGAESGGRGGGDREDAGAEAV
jgi:hypothetical protein